MSHERDVHAAGRSIATAPSFIKGLWGVRYQVKDVARSVEFYTQRLGFKLDHERPPAFAQVSIGALKLILSGGFSSTAGRPISGARRLEPCRAPGRRSVDPNRRPAGRRTPFPQRYGVGPGGKQIQIEDPDGNPIELFEPAS